MNNCRFDNAQFLFRIECRVRSHIDKGPSSPPFLLVAIVFDITPNFSEIHVTNDAKQQQQQQQQKTKAYVTVRKIYLRYFERHGGGGGGYVSYHRVSL